MAQKAQKTQKTTIRRYKITPGDRIEILWKQISKGRDTWDFYDVKYGDVIITDCKLIEGSKGTFLGMPSRENNGSWYPLVYVKKSLGDKLVEYITDADSNDDWVELDDGEILSFDKKGKNDE